MSYFTNFPTILYDGVLSTNITLRAKFKEDLAKYLSSYYEYEIKDSKRPDQVAHEYYNDPYLSWIVFFSNDMIDPLSEWYKDNITFENYIISKYGSLDEARSRILFYRVNWYGDESIKTNSEYSDPAFVQERKYWSPNMDSGNNVLNYKRKPLSLAAETNRTYKITYTNLAGDLEVGDIVLRYSSGSLVARGEVCFIGDGYFNIKHVYDASGFTGTLTVRNKSTTLVIDEVSVVSADIPYLSYSGVDEEKYWEPIYAYDYEMENNEQNRLIRVVNRAYTRKIVGEMRTIFRT